MSGRNKAICLQPERRPGREHADGCAYDETIGHLFIVKCFNKPMLASYSNKERAMARPLAHVGLSIWAVLATSMGAAASPGLPAPGGILGWSGPEQRVGYARMDAIFPHRVVRRGGFVHPIPRRAREWDPTFIEAGQPRHVADFMRLNRAAAVVVLKRGRVVLERYTKGVTQETRWTSFSIGKSITSVLLGAAIADGAVGSVEDPVTRYILELRGSAYDGVSIAQALEMRSGVRWNEDYTDPTSDVGRLVASTFQNKGDNLIDLMRPLSREAAPGPKFVYKTGESNLIGQIVARATGRHLGDYLSEKIWARYGMERDAVWVTNGGQEIGGCCLSATARDYARLGQFVLENDREGPPPKRARVLPAGWVRASVTPYTRQAVGDLSYGYQWWVYPDGSYGADGIFGQSVIIYPHDGLVIVTLGAWPEALWEEGYARRGAFVASILGASRREDAARGSGKANAL